MPPAMATSLFGAAPQPDRSSSRAASRSILAVEQVSSPMQPGTLAGRSTYDSEAAGFVYLATDQSPAEYYFRQGASGWSAAVTVQGPKGDTGPAGPAGATGQLDRLVLKEIRARPAPPARLAQPEQQAPQDQPAQRARPEQLVQRAPKGDVGARVFVGPSTPAPSAANYDIWIVTP